jgi:Phosphate-selective porin O and P
MNKFLVFLFFIVPAAHAQQLHVFGGWAYGKTNGNAYLAGTHAGAFDSADLALNVAASPVEALRLEGQFAVDVERGVQTTSIDYAFAEWRVSDAARLRVGRLKHPFGIYTEIYDVGTLRPFFALPQAVYGPVGTLAEAYNGVGLSGFRKLGTWSVSYDVYAGELDLPYTDFDDYILDGGHGAKLDVRNVLGGRAVVETPVDGLSFGASTYTGAIDSGSARLVHKAAGAQVEYLTDRLSLRGEWIANRTGTLGEHAGYAEAAWRFTPRWQAAVRFDGLQEVHDRTASGRHNETSAGINYWFTRHFVVKLSAHHIDGTHLMLPNPATGSTMRETHALMFGSQFSF